MSCGTLLRTRVRFSPPPPAGRSAGWLAREGETVEHQLEGGIVAARGLFDLVGVGLVLEHDDHRAAGGSPRRDHDLFRGRAGHPRLAHLVSLREARLYLVLWSGHDTYFDRWSKRDSCGPVGWHRGCRP